MYAFRGDLQTSMFSSGDDARLLPQPVVNVSWMLYIFMIESVNLKVKHTIKWHMRLTWAVQQYMRRATMTSNDRNILVFIFRFEISILCLTNVPFCLYVIESFLGGQKNLTDWFGQQDNVFYINGQDCKKIRKAR